MNGFLNFVALFVGTFSSNQRGSCMSPTDVVATDAICPQCRTGMVHVAVTPHPVVRNMQRNTFVCYSRKRTRTYMLPGKPDIDFREGEAAQHA